MDKKAIIDQVYYGLPKPVEGYLPPTSWAYNAELPKHEYNPDKAKQILEEAGWKAGGDGVRAKGGVRLSFTNATTAGNKLREQTQALVQQNWRAIGVEMQITNMPAAVIWGEYYVKSKFETLLVGIQASVGDDPDCLNRIHSKYIAAKTGSGRNVSQYENPAVDKLLEDGVREIDRAEAPRHLSQAPGGDSHRPRVPAHLQLRAHRGREAGHRQLHAQQQHADE